MIIAIRSHFRLLVFAIAVAALAAAFWYWCTNAARLNTAIENLRACEKLAEEIRSVQLLPQAAKADEWSQDDLGAAVEAAATDAGLGRDRILRIDPQSPRRVGKSDYVEQATEVELSNVTLRQLVEFAFGISNRDDQLENGVLRLRVPHGSSEKVEEELWLADLVLTQRIYLPAGSHR
jgi:hypothetical protein